MIAYGTNTKGSSLGQQDPSDQSVNSPRMLLWTPEWGVVSVREPQWCTVSDEHGNRELQPQHSLAIVRIHHPGQRLNSGGAGRHVQTCKPVYEQPPAALSASERDTGPDQINATLHSAQHLPICPELPCYCRRQ